MVTPDNGGAQEWSGVHVTHRTTVAEIYNVDNVGPDGNLLAGFDMFRYAGDSLDALIRNARDADKRVLPIGAGWALSRINITDGWLVNTKRLNGCYDVGERYFDDAYPAAGRRNVVLNEQFAAKINAELIRDDDVFNAAVVSFGTFGIIAAVAVETVPIYQLEFPPIADIDHADLKAKLTGWADAPPDDLYHYEFIFDPHSRNQMAMEACAPKVPYEPGVPTPTPRWIVRDKNGYAPGINILRFVGPLRAVVPPRIITGFEFRSYRKLALLNDVRGSPGRS